MACYYLQVFLLYKLPQTTAAFNSFIMEFLQYLELFVLCTEPQLICRDFNIHVDIPGDADAQTLPGLINSMGLVQYVSSAIKVH